jgi:hypothetical protein
MSNLSEKVQAAIIEATASIVATIIQKEPNADTASQAATGEIKHIMELLKKEIVR